MRELPREIWNHVFDSLFSGDMHTDWLRTHDVCSICLANKQLRAVAQPYLFTRIEISSAYQAPAPSISVAFLARALHRRPDLAAAVQSITLTTVVARRARTIGDQEGDDLKEYLAQAARQLELPFAANLAEEIDDARVDCFVTIALALTPNITSLSLQGPFAENTEILSTLIMHSSPIGNPNDKTHPLLQRLRQVTYHPKLSMLRTVAFSNMLDVAPLLYLPSLERLDLMMEHHSTVPWPIASPPDLSKLTHLTIAYTHADTLGTILKLTRALQYLDWTWVVRNEPSGAVINLHALGKALLQSCATTLRTLKLGGEAEDFMDRPTVAIGCLGDLTWLQRMTSLVELQITPRFLIKIEWQLGRALDEVDTYRLTLPVHECLPPTIRRVCFTDDFDNLAKAYTTKADELAAIREWWQVKETVSPLLEEFTLRLGMEEVVWSQRQKDALRDLGAEFGVRVRIINS